jgi:hypothetical protein
MIKALRIRDLEKVRLQGVFIEIIKISGQIPHRYTLSLHILDSCDYSNYQVEDSNL